MVATLSTMAQKKDEIVEWGIEVKQFYDQDIKDGEKEPYLVKEEFYTPRGEISEIKEYKNEGTEIDKWYKYKYDQFNFLIEEQELNSKGEQKERVVYIYKNGLRVERQEYDDKDRLSKIRKYEYGFRK